MSSSKALRVLGHMDADLIEEAEIYHAAKKNVIWVRRGAIAACLCLCIFGAMRFASARKSADVSTAPAAASTMTESAGEEEEAVLCEKATDTVSSFSLYDEAPAPEAAAAPAAGYNGSVPTADQEMDSNEKTAFLSELCRNYLLANEPEGVINTITDLDAPIIRILEELPGEGCWLALSERSGTGPWYEVTFTTTADGWLGPLTYLVNQESVIIGVYCRE